MASTMDLSQPLIRRGVLLAALATLSLGAVSTAAVASTTDPTTVPPYGLPYKGVLMLAPQATDRQVQYFAPGNTTASATQGFVALRRNSCQLRDPVGLLNMTAANFSSRDSAGTKTSVGLVGGSLGAYYDSNGIPCSRIESSIGQALTTALGTLPAVANVENPAFYRLELDIEAKSNLELELEILRKTKAGTYEVAELYTLRTGLSIKPGEGVDADRNVENGTQPDDERIFNCPSTQSDSGPDAGALDNCRWSVNQLGHAFRLRPTVGQGSLEGGSDTPEVTKIYLTDLGDDVIIGTLGCEGGVNGNNTSDELLFGEGNEGSCIVTRVAPVGGTCPATGYALRVVRESSREVGCELLKAPGTQLVASLDITFPPEPRTALGDEDKTFIRFTTGQPAPDNLSAPFYPDRCVGTLVPDANNVLTVEEVLSPGQERISYSGAPLTGTNDPVPGLGTVEWACVLYNTQDYLSKQTPALCTDSQDECMQVRQTTLLWGDISFSRN
jgi:hypothetical protein